MNYNELIYKLIFGNQTEFCIDVSDYINDIYEHEDFVFNIKDVLKKAKVKIIKSKIDVNSKTVEWYLKVKKN
jgi:hypothetical protein